MFPLSLCPKYTFIFIQDEEWEGYYFGLHLFLSHTTCAQKVSWGSALCHYCPHSDPGFWKSHFETLLVSGLKGRALEALTWMIKCSSLEETPSLPLATHWLELAYDYSQPQGGGEVPPFLPCVWKVESQKIWEQY